MDDTGANGAKMETSHSVVDEKKILDEFDDLIEDGYTWYLISNKWFDKWKRFIEVENGENPGPIDNASLLEGDTNELQENLADEMDYRLVPDEAWKKLHNIYGLAEGQEPIARKAIVAGTYSKQTMVEIYPPVVKLKRYGNEEKVLKEPFSRVTKLDIVHKKMKELFEIPESTKTRIQIEDSVDPINEDRTLDELSIGSKTTLVLEKQNEDGTWERTTAPSPPSYSKATSSTSTSSKTIKPKSSYSNSYNGSYGTRSSSWYNSSREEKPGLCGLSNLGNTCFMNSAIQCLSNVPPLTMYFQDGKYRSELNSTNPIGMGGELAKSYATLIHDMWDGTNSSVAPRDFKYRVSRFAPQFSGYQQHDSQELLAFLIDGLHEDLNRIEKKPYIELEDSFGKPDEEVAKQAWDNHLRRNDSVIVDMFHGLFKSTIVCPDCDRVSVTFDPFGFLSLPLPKARDMYVTCTFVPRNSNKPVTKYKLSLPKDCSVKELYNALAEKAECNAEQLVMADIYNHRFYKVFKKSDKLTSYNTRDDLFVYELGFDDDGEDDSELSYARVIMRHGGDESYSMRPFAHPFLIPVKRSNTSYRKFYNSVLSAVSRYVKKEFRDGVKMLSEWKKFELNESMGSDVDGNEIGDATNEQSETEEEEERKWFKLVQMDHTGTSISKELKDDSKPIKFSNETNFAAEWQTSVCEEYAVNDWSETFKNDPSMKEHPAKEGFSIQQCMKLFTTEEKLGVHDEWYCPSCKEHKQATKKFDLWALPPILIIHLKRFSYTRWSRDKIGTYVDFPIRDLDFSDFIINPAKDQWKPTQQKYNLIGVSNHYGSLGGGHYTAYALNYKENKWYYFDDSSVSTSSEDSVKTKAAYMLMYQRQDMEDWVKKGGKDNFVFLESMVSPRATQTGGFHFDKENTKAQQRNRFQNGGEEQETAMETD